MQTVKNKSKVLKVLFVALLSVGLVTEGDACTSLIVGKDASTTGSIIVARNEDFSTNNWVKYSVIREAQTHQKGTQMKFNNGLSVPMPEKTLRYTAMPDWDSASDESEDGPFEEFGVNSANVAVSATNSASSNEAVVKLDPYTKGSVEESVIPSLLLPQATTAREGVELLGQYIEQYGAGESNIVMIADPKEVWVFEIGSGHHWIAVRVPDDSYVVIANQLRVSGVNLDDSANVITSKGLYDFVVENKLLAEPNKQDFNFAKAFGHASDEDFYNVDREWFGQHLFTPSKPQAERQNQYPFLMTPDKKISVEAVARFLGNPDYKGTVIEGKSIRTIGLERQIESHILELRANMPHEFQALNWQSYGALKDSFLIPQYLGAIKEFPKEYQMGSDQYDSDSAWWSFRMLTTLANVNPEKYRTKIHALRKDEDGKRFKEVAQLDKKLKSLYKKDPQAAVQQANEYSVEQANETLRKVRHLNSQIITDMTKSTEKKYTPEQFEKIKNL